MILLDSHVVVWLALDPERISRKALASIEESRHHNEALGVSDITLLEIATSASKGRIKLDSSLETFLSEVEARFVVLPITARISARAVGLPASYPKDPADRVIGATALVEGVPLITADGDIRRSRALRTIW